MSYTLKNWEFFGDFLIPTFQVHMFCNPLFSNHLPLELRGEKINATDNVHNETTKTKQIVYNTEPLLCLRC